jgi:[protein-PII] uridylyltransferase
VSQLAGACALTGASIVEARIFTLKNGKALDVFAIQDSEGGPFDQPTRLARLTATIERVLGAPEQTLAALKTLPPHVNPKTSAFPVAPRVLIDNKPSRTSGSQTPRFRPSATARSTHSTSRIASA